MTNIFNEILSNENLQKQQLMSCLATILIDNISPDATIDLQFDDDQCKTPNERLNLQISPNYPILLHL